MSESISSVLDEAHLNELREIAEDRAREFLDDLMRTFEPEWSRTLAEIQSACSARDEETLRKKVHFLAGSSGNLGFCRLASIFSNVERQLKENQFSSWNTCVAIFQEEHRQAVQAFKAYIEAL